MIKSILPQFIGDKIDFIILVYPQKSRCATNTTAK